MSAITMTIRRGTRGSTQGNKARKRKKNIYIGKGIKLYLQNT